MHYDALKPNILPVSLNHLKTNYLFERHSIGLDVLPSSLETLQSQEETDYKGDPVSYSEYNFPLLPKILPSSLKVLKLGASFKKPIGKDPLPASLQILHLGHYFNHTIDHLLPQTLSKLYLSNNSTLPIGENVLPQTLTKLH